MDSPTPVAVIGLEVHVQLLTRAKIFSGESTAYGASPNTHVSAVTLAHPGTLPKLNTQAVTMAIRMGLACQSAISPVQIFDRKNYFYPDLPKGYQITQDRTPIARGGVIRISSKEGERTIELNRIHLEEDAGKSIHEENSSATLLDFNRAGVALIEIVTTPCLRNSDEAYALLTEIRRLVRWLGICDGNMEEGSLRCDANVSVMPHGSRELGKKVEVKNMNSVRNVQRAIDHEISRQTMLLQSGRHVVAETRTFDAAAGTTSAMRMKEDLNDYRYFPDPDLSPLVISASRLAEIRKAMPALPWELRRKFTDDYKLSAYDAQVLTDAREVALSFDATCQRTKNFKAAANWMMGPVKAHLKGGDFSAELSAALPDRLAELISLIDNGQVSFSVASQVVFPELLRHPEEPVATLAGRLNVVQDSVLGSLQPIIDQVIKEFPIKVEEYRNGKKGILAMFMGEVMRRSKGKADPKVATELLTKKLEAV
jgi:aspartyl-tRNA(Asn)/glutamyl-tRNA(Gln) amidotransferase subunit B